VTGGSSVNLNQGKFAFLTFGLAVTATVCLCYFLSLSSGAPVKAGEHQTYGICTGDEKVGELSLQIDGEESVENVMCFVARYSLYLPRVDMARSGVLKFDGQGVLRRAVTAEAQAGALRWRTEIGYSPAEGLMRVIVEDNRNPDNFFENDWLMELPEKPAVGEFLWYLPRFTSLAQGSRIEANASLMPYATNLIHITLTVENEEIVETPAGSFECWFLTGENTCDIPWPIDRIWIDKKTKIVVKATELGEEETLYILENL